MAESIIRLKVEGAGGDSSPANKGGGFFGGLRAGIFGGKAGGMAGGIGKITGSLGLVTGIMGIISGGIKKIVGILAQSSGIFKSVLGGIWKTLLRILKPIGDILGIALMPILLILRPIGLLFNALMKPYLSQAMKAMRAGGTFLKAGKGMEAMGAFGLGFQFLMKPFFDAFVSGLTQIIGSIFVGMKDIPIIGGMMEAAGENIKLFGKGAVEITNTMLNEQLKILTTGANEINTVFRTLNMSEPLKTQLDLSKEYAEKWGLASVIIAELDKIKAAASGDGAEHLLGGGEGSYGSYISAYGRNSGKAYSEIIFGTG